MGEAKERLEAARIVTVAERFLAAIAALLR